jgi:chorismate dehydratase
LDGLAVSGRGFVGSVQVFLRRPIESVRSVALDPSSRTAATLARVLLAERNGTSARFDPVRFEEVPEGADPREAGTDAWLRIGDAALREHLAPASPPVFNPSRAWTERTGLPFVFAAWIVRPDVDVAEHVAAFVRARERGARAAKELARSASAEWSLPEAACAHYLERECLFEPGRELRPSLFAFRDAAAKLDLCRSDLEPRALELSHVA